MGDCDNSPFLSGQNLAGRVPFGENIKMRRCFLPDAVDAPNDGSPDKKGRAAVVIPNSLRK
jgi:hypothetical protein